MVEVRFNKPKFSRFSSKSVKRSFSTSSQRRAVQVSVDKRNQYYAAIATNVSALSFGTMFGWSGTAWPGLKESGSIGEATHEEESWIGSIIILGALLSGFVTGSLNERFGRRRVMLGLTVPCLTGWALIYFAQSFAMIYAGRVLTGFAGGASSIVVPIYIGETADPKIRGTLLAGYDLGIACGFCYIAMIGSFVSWRMQVVACAMITVVGHLLMLRFVVESPRYLIAKGDIEGARESCEWLQKAPPFSPSVNTYVNELVELAENRKKKRCDDGKSSRIMNSINRILAPEILLPCFVTLMIHLLSSFSAQLPIAAYTVEIFNSTATDLDAFQATMIFGGLDAISSIIAAIIVDRLGRRPLLIFSQFTMAVALMAMGVFFWLKNQEDGSVLIKDLHWLPVTSLGIFVFAFSIGTGPVSYMINGEMLPPEAKGFIAGIINMLKWLSGFFVTKYFLLLMSIGESIGYGVFAGICMAGGFFVIFCVPETKGKSLEEIQMNFASSSLDDDSLENANV